MTHYIVRARSDGRAGMPMFGLSGPRAKSFAGQTVHIGDREVTVGPCTDDVVCHFLCHLCYKIG